MKKELKKLVILVSCISILSCSKTTRDLTANIDRVDILFGNLKSDSSFQEYFFLLKNTSEVFMDNAKKTGKADTAILNSKALSMKEKYEKLGYSNFGRVENNSLKLASLFYRIKAKYPEFAVLSEAENAKLMLLSKAYYSNLKGQ